mmetsp:Transcript_28779/g.98042  ORF Transcript_28779/g.98042 Transcript_28779/m.98042 type:complete len:120 (-) Transcript_28779:16-375(-)
MRLVVFLGLLGAGSSLRLTNPPPPRRAALARGVLAIAGAALVAPTVAPRPAAAAPVPDGCVWKGDGEYPGRASGMPVKEMNKNLDCNEGFVKGFTASELVFTPAVLGLAAVLARVQGKD